VCGDLQRCMDMLLMALQLRMQLAVFHAPSRTHSSSRPLIAHAALYRIAWRLSAQSMILPLGVGKLHVRMCLELCRLVSLLSAGFRVVAGLRLGGAGGLLCEMPGVLL
jgi:hypothetical protein